MKTTYLFLVFVLFGLAIQAQGYDQEIQVYREQQAQHLKKICQRSHRGRVRRIACPLLQADTSLSSRGQCGVSRP